MSLNPGAFSKHGHFGQDQIPTNGSNIFNNFCNTEPSTNNHFHIVLHIDQTDLSFLELILLKQKHISFKINLVESSK